MASGVSGTLHESESRAGVPVYIGTIIHSVTEILVEAYRKPKSNRGAAGLTEMTFEIDEEQGLQTTLQKTFSIEMKERRYVRNQYRVYIPETGWEGRPLGIPTVRDRSCKRRLSLMVLNRSLRRSFARLKLRVQTERGAHDSVRISISTSTGL